MSEITEPQEERYLILDGESIPYKWIPAHTALADLETYIVEAQKYYAKREEKHPKDINILLVTYEELEAIQRAEYITEPKQVSEEKFIDMLEVLPPLCHRVSTAGESFLMSEMNIGTYTYQYRSIGNVYLSKGVDLHDEDTWIKTEDFDGLKPLPEDSEEADA